MLRLLIVLFIGAFFQIAWAADLDCTMQPAPIDIGRIAHRPEIKSYTVDANKLAVTALLKNGRALRLIHMGCAHSGAEAALWFNSEVPASDVNTWLKEAIALTKIAFSPGISRDIERSLKTGNYRIEKTDNRLVITASPTEYFTYTILFAPLEHGVMLSVIYSFG